jgi:glutathione S-transferase
MAKATLTISSKNYSSWSLRGWLLTRFSGLEFEEITTAPDDASARAEILLLSSSILVPCLRHDGATIWDTLAIAEYLNETMPDAGLLPADRVQRAHCRSICGEIHSGFTTLRASLPVNLKGHFPTSRSGRAPRPTSTGSARSGASASPIPAGRSCSANAPWRTPCMRRSSPAS